MEWLEAEIKARQAGTGQTRDVVVRKDTNVAGTGQPAISSSLAKPGLSQLEYLLAAIREMIPSSYKNITCRGGLAVERQATCAVPQVQFRIGF